ncbi:MULTISPECIES: hypothetical protein [unclassified Streptomyces]|uniref:hypothetical protein n=1 Tax=unclassified Streptomyces TaxID=2593676 RepID=UPI002366C30A|nr:MULTISPECIES: hypothetical protein [unclassified Streptomyces]MDF3140888.1 hypothetical protein [Streptomyces sp. T21Q-yed]WDF43508.1 hypothetical protein PBV52_45380 [Streptomyces sp. T12]
MPALTPDAIHAATETLSDLTCYLRENPDPAEALALVEPLLDEYTGLPVQLADTLRALARALQDHADIPRTAQVDLLITELRTAAWEQADQHTLHYVLDDLRHLHDSAGPREPAGD